MSDPIEGLFASLEQSPYRYLLHDPERRRRLLATIMAESSDSTVREMGEQLRDGQVSLAQLLTVPDYADALSRGADRLAEVDLDEVTEQVDAETQREEAETG